MRACITASRVRALAMIAAGGGVGSVARYLVVTALPARTMWGTVLVNITGCLLVGFILVHAAGKLPRSAIRPFWLVGFFGGFTTFSAYSWEIRDMLGRGAPAEAAGYALGGVVAGVLAVWAGAGAARFARVPRSRSGLRLAAEREEA